MLGEWMVFSGSIFLAHVAAAQAAKPPDYTVRGYKTIGSDSLVMHVFVPQSSGTKRPAAVLLPSTRLRSTAMPGHTASS